MLQVLLIIWCVSSPLVQNTVTANTWIADGWVENKVETINLYDYFSTKPVSNVILSGLVVEVLPDSNSLWRIIASDGSRIIAIQDGYNTRKLDIETERNVMIQSPSRDFVLLSSWDGDAQTLTRYNMETGEKFELDVRESIRENLFGSPNYLMSEDGTIFFTDPAGIVGSCYMTETNISLNENPILVFGNALSSDGNLYATSFSNAIQNLTLTGYSALEGILWQVNTPGAHHDNPCISENGGIISFIKPTNGITILNGGTGETLNSILPNMRITSQALSPNGEYVAVSIPCEDTRNSFMHACINTGTSYSENSFNYNDEPIIQGSLNIIAVANDGAYILRTVTYAEEREM